MLLFMFSVWGWYIFVFILILDIIYIIYSIYCQQPFCISQSLNTIWLPYPVALSPKPISENKSLLNCLTNILFYSLKRLGTVVFSKYVSSRRKECIHCGIFLAMNKHSFGAVVSIYDNREKFVKLIHNKLGSSFRFRAINLSFTIKKFRTHQWSHSCHLFRCWGNLGFSAQGYFNSRRSLGLKHQQCG